MTFYYFVMTIIVIALANHIWQNRPTMPEQRDILLGHKQGPAPSQWDQFKYMLKVVFGRVK